MRNTGNKTPSSKQDQKEEAAAEKSSGKKLVQARLPFKILASGASSPATVDAIADIDAAPVTERKGSADASDDLDSKQDARKRKLSYNEDKAPELPSTESKENVSIVASKKKKTSITVEDEVVVLNDSDTEDDAEAKLNTTDVKIKSVVPSIISAASPKTPVQGSTKRKGAGTPKSISASGSVGRKESPRGSATKLQIKLPLSSKKKRRKSQRQSIIGDVESTPDAKTYSSDEIEIISQEQNPLKRPKVDAIMKGSDAEEKHQKEDGGNHSTIRNIINSPSRKSNRISPPAFDDRGTDTKTSPKDKSENAKITAATTEEKEKLDIEAITIDDDLDHDSSKTSSSASKNLSKKKLVKTLDGFISKGGSVTKGQTITPEKKQATRSKSINKKAPVDVPDEADDDEHVDNSSVSSEIEVICLDIDEKTVVNEQSKITEKAESATSSLVNNSATAEQPKGALTPKQQRLIEQRRVAREDRERRLQEQREERERKLQEEKIQKQREREEKELSKKKEREEKEEQKRKEREEKEEVKRKDREEKERKRLADVDAKNEERRKRNEVKEEELRKREEERKRKEQEKEEAENKKKKAAEAFTKFFVPKSTNPSIVSETAQQLLVKNGAEVDKVGSESLAFRPFQVKGDMQLAPLVRKVFTEADREKLDSFLTTSASSQLLTKPSYLSELRTGEIKPGKWRRPTVDTKEEDDDVVIVEDELERAAQTIVEESGRTVERYRAKLYKFHENRRPPYFGTWRKKTNVITPRRPLAQDKKHFDYEVDSDLEWEEEEPGESLDGSDEEKEKESEDEDYEVDNEWFVPHGHLSDEEMQNEDECCLGDDNTREAQKAKLKLLQQEFAQEMKKKTEKIKPRLVGCIWQDFNGNQPELCPNIIWNSLNMRAMLYTKSPIVEEPIVESNSETNETSSPTITSSVAGVTEKLKRILLTEDMLKDLIRLVHGNRHSKVFLINEFIAHIEQSEDAIKNGDVRGPLKSVVRDKIDELALWQVTEANNKNKTKKNKKKLCWLVSEEKLKEYDLQSLELHNNWSYTLPPKFVERVAQNDEELAEGSGNPASDKGSSKSSISQKKVKNKTITKFTKVLTAEEKAEKQQRMADDAKIGSKVNTPTSSKKRKSIADSTSSSKVTPNSNQAAPDSGKPAVPTIKKRVPLLMSVARGQQISTPAKNALISQFLKKSKDGAEKNESPASATTKMDVDEVVLLD